MHRTLVFLILLSCGALAACTEPLVPTPVGAKPGCDRNGDYEQRVAC